MNRKKFIGTFIVVIFAFLGLTACQPATATPMVTVPPATQGSLPNTGSQGGGAGSSGAPTINSVDALLNAIESQYTANSFRSTTVTTDGNKTTKIVLEYVKPDKIHEIVGNQEYLVIFNQGTWQKVNGKWQASPTNLIPSAFSFLDLQATQALHDSIVPGQIQSLGSDTINGIPMKVYQFATQVPGSNGGTLKGVTKLWVGANDGLPYREESIQDSAANPGEKTNTVTTIEYDPNITIETP